MIETVFSSNKFGFLVFGHWSLFGIWCLRFGAYFSIPQSPLFLGSFNFLPQAKRSSSQAEGLTVLKPCRRHGDPQGPQGRSVLIPQS
jgi:hypothetical protein